MKKGKETIKAKSAKKPVKVKEKKEKKENYFVGVRKEMAMVTWPTKGNVLKYTISTVVFILFVVGFFLLLNLFLSVVKGWFI